ncbi:50S ribosomal protein L25/general stress protein Ctc [Lysinibacillus odysseyi]|uniref:Large ribosomal subunit protein bL25 n=1 Tax=Lysinibacillus odysseyi 34hs-1 = NBRC 100172 TaxID=1220589 RepID=A0A0A3JLS7_9BACI|nr:50S ribosomal protein L25/general stress protein Ctc [Lysinibacillus odysseyi]KGR87942.1 50S ribosomal protein L25 [Lysinibacillus odysseyi 34hs-1 = NBRC 100172]
MSTVLEATKRETGARSILTEVRNNGSIPANVYGYKTEATPISVEAKSLLKELQTNGQNAVFKLNIEGKTVNAVINEIQRCALKGHVKHIDFQAINMSEEIEVEVPITIVGESAGVKEGGVLTQPNRDIKIKVKPSDIPEAIEIDVSNLNVGDTLSLADVRGKINFEVLNDDDYTLATITPPTKVEADADAEAVTADDVEATGEKLDPERPGRED